jgi:hypothetical protein
MFINRDLQFQHFLDKKKISSIMSETRLFGFIAMCHSEILIHLKLLRFFSSSNYLFQYYLQMWRARGRMWNAIREVAK